MADEGGVELSGRPSVLLIEDNSEMRRYLRKHLVPHYDVHEAVRGDEGLALARAHLPDLIVSDVMMPGLDGHALCRALKSEPETDFIPVVLLTARTDFGSRLEGLEGGANDYLTKPFDPQELLLRLRNLLSMRSRLAARYGEAQEEPVAVQMISSSASDMAVVERLRSVLLAGSGDPDFNVPALAAGMAMSRAQLHRRITQVCGLSPAEIIIRFRLDRAARLLLGQSGSIAEVADAVGFRNISHFTRRFREQFGQTPAAYRKTMLK